MSQNQRDGGEIDHVMDDGNKENRGIDNFSRDLISLTDRVNKFQAMIREKRIEYNIFSNSKRDLLSLSIIIINYSI